MFIDTNQRASSRNFSYGLDSRKGHSLIMAQCSVTIKERKDTRKRKEVLSLKYEAH